MITFDTIRARAEARKGGAAALVRLLPPKPDPKALAALKDDRVLAEMAKRVFCAGFAWRVIEAKWPGFEEAFLGFEPTRLLFEPDEYWEVLARDTRIVRNAAKIFSVRRNAGFVRDIAKEHKSFGRFLAEWPSSDEIGLLESSRETRRPARRQYRPDAAGFLGWDGFAASKDVVACLRHAGVDIAEEVKSKRDLKLMQEQFNSWAKETGLPYVHLSRICALSIGENYSAHEIERRGRGDP